MLGLEYVARFVDIAILISGLYWTFRVFVSNPVMKTQLLRILVSTVICLRNVDLVNCESNIVPKTFKSRFGGSKTIGLGVAGAAALAAFKYIQDGPKFDEPVSLAGQNIAITGANTGLGKEAALKLASLGARVILLCRPSKKTDDTVAEIKKATGSEQVEAVPLDLTDLASVSQCAQTLRKKLDKLDVLMNNAGVMAIPTREETRDGFEKQIGTNHLGHFLLTAELMNLLKRAPAARCEKYNCNCNCSCVKLEHSLKQSGDGVQHGSPVRSLRRDH